MNTVDFITTVVLGAPLVLLAIFDVSMARRIHRKDYPPPIPLIRLIRYLVDAIAIGAVCWAVLGIASAVFTATGIRLTPFPISLVLIYVAATAGSLALIPLKRRMDAWAEADRQDPLASEEPE